MNPCDVLDVPWDADKATLVKAQARALKARKHAPQVIAEAFRALMDDEARLLAAFCQVPWGKPAPVIIPEAPSEEPGALPDFPLVDFAGLLADLHRRIDADDRAASALDPAAVREPLPAPAQLLLSLDKARKHEPD